MSLRDLFGRGGPKAEDPEQLKQRLFGAAEAGVVTPQLEKLCRDHRDAIVGLFPGWRQVPEAQRKDPAVVQRYATALITIAHTFADRLGAPELLQSLVGAPQNNPLQRWQQDLEQAREEMNGLRYAAARERLSNLLIDVRGLSGSGVDSYLPFTLGMLGVCYFQGRQAEQALAPMQQALQLCRQHGDMEGVAAYLGNLYEAHRYLGQAEPAAAYAGQLADLLAQQGQSDQARLYRRQAEIVRAGEPLNRVVAVVNERELELDEVGDLGGEDQSVQFIFRRNRPTLRPAAVLTDQGEKHGGAGRYDEALDAFRAAAEADPFDPHCRYLEGLTLLHLQRHVEAVESYQATEERAPGWFHCRADLWLAQQLALGQLEHELFLALRGLEEGETPAEEKVRMAEALLQRAPRLAPLHLLHGKALAQVEQRREAEAALRRGLACGPEPDVKSRLLVELSAMTDDSGERSALLREAQDPSGNLVAAAMATLFLKMGSPRRGE